MALEYPIEQLESRIQFRAMRIEDIPAVCRIEQESFQLPWTAEAFHNELTNNQFAKYTIIEWNKELIGYGGMWIIIDEAHVTNIAIQSSHRGKKLGTKLLIEMQHIACSLGARHMTLEVRTSNAAAQHVYEKLGFRFMGVRKGYYTDNGEDAIIMWAELDSKKEGNFDDEE